MNPPAARLDAHRHGAPVAERCTENNAEASPGRVGSKTPVHPPSPRSNALRVLT